LSAIVANKFVKKSTPAAVLCCVSSINLNLSGKGFYCVSHISVMKMNRTGKQRQKKVASTQDEESEEEVVSYLLARYLI
jgi:hypothetical protein